MGALADRFQEIVDSLPDDWTHLDLDLRIDDAKRYVDAALYLLLVNAHHHTRHPEGYHWRIICAHRFGHAAAAPAEHGTLKLLDDGGITGTVGLVGVRGGRAQADRRRRDHRAPRPGRRARGRRRGRAGGGAPRVVPAGGPARPRAVVLVARVVGAVPDLLFGSKVRGMLAAAGHEGELVG